MTRPYRTAAHIERAKALRREWWELSRTFDWYAWRANNSKIDMCGANTCIDQTETD